MTRVSPLPINKFNGNWQSCYSKADCQNYSDRVVEIELSSTVKTIGDVKVALEKHGVAPVAHQCLISQGAPLDDKEPVPAPETPLYLFFYEPAALVADPIDTASDWDTKNRMKVFKGLYLFSIRKFAEACPLLIDSLTTLGGPEIYSFQRLCQVRNNCSHVGFGTPCYLPKASQITGSLEVIENLSYGRLYQCVL